MRASKVYLKGAKRIDSKPYSWRMGCCGAIDTDDFTRSFDFLFKPRPQPFLVWWGNGWANTKACNVTRTQGEQIKACRVLALLLMSAIAADEERK